MVALWRNARQGTPPSFGVGRTSVISPRSSGFRATRRGGPPETCVSFPASPHRAWAYDASHRRKEPAMNPLDTIATALVVIGGLNWGVVAARKKDLVTPLM